MNFQQQNKCEIKMFGVLTYFKASAGLYVKSSYVCAFVCHDSFKNKIFKLLHSNQLGKPHHTNTEFRSVERGEKHCTTTDLTTGLKL